MSAVESSASVIIDVSEADFEREVVERSHSVPVVVDFWAAWCAPCRVLGPVLEKLAVEFGGAFVLAKVDTEANQALASAFGIRGIPSVKVIREARVVDEFTGALPEEAVRRFLREHCPSEADKLMQEAAEALDTGRPDEALETLGRVLEADSAHTRAHLLMARLALSRRDAALARTHLAAIPPLADEADQAQAVREALSFIEECPGADEQERYQERVAANEADFDARYALGCCFALAGSYRKALDLFLAIVVEDKKYRDEAARKAMVTIFGLLGKDSELASEYRRRLTIYL